MPNLLRRLSTWRTASRTEKTALWLIAIGFSIPTIVFVGYTTINWTPLDAPVELVAEHATVFRFRVNMGGNYRISIRTDKTIPFQILDCMLGLVRVPEKVVDCKNTPTAVDLRWKLIRSKDSSLVEQGNYNDQLGGGYSDSNIDAEFAQVRVPRGKYVLEIVPTRDGNALQIAHPRAHFEADNDYYVGSIILHLASVFIGVVLVIIGCTIMAVYELRSTKFRRTDNKPHP